MEPPVCTVNAARAACSTSSNHCQSGMIAPPTTKPPRVSRTVGPPSCRTLKALISLTSTSSARSISVPPLQAMLNPRHPVKASGLGCNITDEVATAAVRLGGQMIALADHAVVVAGLDEQRR